MVVEKKGEYVKGEKRQEKYNQIKENLQKKKERYIQKGQQKKKKHGKNRCSRQREWTNMEKHTNLRRCPTKS